MKLDPQFDFKVELTDPSPLLTLLTPHFLAHICTTLILHLCRALLLRVD